MPQSARPGFFVARVAGLSAGLRTQLRVGYRNKRPNGFAAGAALLTCSILVAFGIGAAPSGSAEPTVEPGRGALDIGDSHFQLRVVRCDLRDAPMPSGYVYELYALARGHAEDRPFFLEVERGRRGTDQQAAIRFYWTDLPTGWWHGGLGPGDAQLEELDRVRRASGFESVSRWGLFPDQLIARGRRVLTVGSVRFLRLRDGAADANAGAGRLSLDCSR